MKPIDLIVAALIVGILCLGFVYALDKTIKIEQQEVTQ
jgi:hypothetical protein